MGDEISLHVPLCLQLNRGCLHIPLYLLSYRVCSTGTCKYEYRGREKIRERFGSEGGSTESALLPPECLEPAEVEDYREDKVMSLSEARELAVKSIHRAQQRYKKQYDRRTAPSRLKAGDWVFVHFPQEESRKMRKLSRPWFGPYRICSKNDPDVTVTRVYLPTNPIQVHLTRVAPCPPRLPAGFYWYGPRCKSPDNPPKWVETVLKKRSGDVTQRESDPKKIFGNEDTEESPQSSEEDGIDNGKQLEDSVQGDPEIAPQKSPQKLKTYPLRSRQRQARDALAERGE